MANISIVTERNIDGADASGNRAQWEMLALKKMGVLNVELIDKFNTSKISQISNNLIHAQQLTGRLLTNLNYIVDAHGLEYIFSSHMSNGYPFHSWRKWSFKLKSYHYEKLENKIFRKSKHVICAGEKIYDKVKNIQNATVVRNAVFPEKFKPSTCKSLKIALVGPFLPGKLNYYGYEIIKSIIKKFPEIEFVFIGETEINFRNSLSQKNTHFVGKVENYIENLQQCSVLLAPYPDYAYYLGSKTKFIEAGACQMPIITTPSGNVDFQNDYVLVGSTVDQLSRHIEYLKSETNRNELGNKLRKEIVKNYNAEIEIQKIIKIYNDYV